MKIDLSTLDLKGAIGREQDISAEIKRLHEKEDKTPADRSRVPELLEEFRAVHEYRLNLEHDAALDEVSRAMEDSTTNDAGTRDNGAQIVDGQERRGATFSAGKYKNPWDTSTMRMGFGDTASTELRSRAIDAIERMPFASDKVREAATRLVERDGEDEAPMARRVLASTSPAYGRAFIKLIRSRGEIGVLVDDERDAYVRSMGLTDNLGGFLVPFQLDPTVILTANGSFNQVRQIARVVQVTGKEWNGITSAGVTGSWDGEGDEVSDDSPTLAQPNIPVHKLQIWVEFSHELEQDAAALADDIAKMIAFEKDVKESISHVTGSGTGQPTGIITALTGTGSVVNSITTDTFAVADVHAIDAALPQRFAFNASWLAHRAIYSKMRQFDTSGGSSLWGQLAEGRKSELLGRPDYVAEAMDGAVNAGQENYVLAYGDFQNYVVVDRVGTTLSYVPHVMGANGRPVGKAGWHAFMRGGGDSVNDGAFRLLNCT